MVVFEYFEIKQKNDPINNPYHSLEIVIYLAILALVGILIDFLIKVTVSQHRTMELLD